MPEVGDLHLHAHSCDQLLQRTTQGCFSRCQTCGSGVKSEFFGACIDCRELLQDVKPGDSGKAPLLVDSASSVWRSLNDIPQAPVAVGDHVPIPFTPPPTRATRPRSSSSDESRYVRSPRRSPSSPYRTQHAPRGRPPNGSRKGPQGFKGVRQRKGVRGFLVEIRPPKWKRTIWLGTYGTDREAAGAYDAGVFYTSKKTAYNFPQLEGTFPPLPFQLRLDKVEDSDEIKSFVQKEARAAAQKVKLLPAPTTTAATAASPAPPRTEEVSMPTGLLNIPFDDEWLEAWPTLVEDLIPVWSFIPKHEDMEDGGLP